MLEWGEQSDEWDEEQLSFKRLILSCYCLICINWNLSGDKRDQEENKLLLFRFFPFYFSNQTARQLLSNWHDILGKNEVQRVWEKVTVWHILHLFCDTNLVNFNLILELTMIYNFFISVFGRTVILFNTRIKVFFEGCLLIFLD